MTKMKAGKLILAGMAILLATGCAGFADVPFKVKEIERDPITGAALTDADGNYIYREFYESQATRQHREKLALVRDQLYEENDQLGQADFADDQRNCSAAAPGAGASEAMQMMYYMVMMECARGGGQFNGVITAETVAAIRTGTTSPAERMFRDMEKTEQRKLDYRAQRGRMWLDGTLGLLNIAKDIHIADISPAGTGGGGGVYVRGDVITTQTASNSRSNSGGALGIGEGEAAPAPLGDNDQYRMIGQSVFGDVGGGIATGASRQALTGSGPTQQLEPSATGVSTLDSEIKGLVASDEWNQDAPYEYDDANDGLNVAGELF